MRRKFTIRIVGEQACPVCGAIAGHHDPALNFPNRPKVADENGVWWWKCCNPECRCGYYEPNSGEWEKKPTSAELSEMVERAKAMVDAFWENGDVKINFIGEEPNA